LCPEKNWSRFTCGKPHLKERRQRGFYYDTAMKHDYKVVSFRLSLSDVRRIPGNRSEFVRHAVAEKLGRESSPAWRPKTAIGRKLLKLRNQFLAQGGEVGVKAFLINHRQMEQQGS
jgi:hypothetical protein